MQLLTIIFGFVWPLLCEKTGGNSSVRPREHYDHFTCGCCERRVCYHCPSWTSI